LPWVIWCLRIEEDDSAEVVYWIKLLAWQWFFS